MKNIFNKRMDEIKTKILIHKGNEETLATTVNAYKYLVCQYLINSIFSKFIVVSSIFSKSSLVMTSARKKCIKGFDEKDVL